VDAKWINAFCTTTVSVFRTMFSVEATPGTPHLKTEPFPTSDISGIIGFSGEATGSIALSFPSATALKAVSALLGTPVTEVGTEVADAIGELANIVAGNVKKEIPQVQLSISLPQVVIGMKHVLSCQSSLATIVVPFTTPLGDFAIEICLKRK
jgi:chemotaxis protein CheX